MRKGSIQGQILQWVTALWGERYSGEEFSVPRLSERTGVSLPAVYRIQAMEGIPSASTLGKIARHFGVPVPTVETRLIAEGEPVQPDTPLVWIQTAKAALVRAEAALAGQATPAPDLGEQSAMNALRADRKGRGKGARSEGRRQAEG